MKLTYGERLINRFALVVLLSVSNSVIAQTFQDPLDAYIRGDFVNAREIWKPMAERGNAIAQTNLGIMYRYGDGVHEDNTEALKWFRLAAEQGDELAQFNLGVMYAEGIGVPKDNAEAVKWYGLAAEQGEIRAQFKLGVMYCKGEGIPKDYVQAYKWLDLAAISGDLIAKRKQETISIQMTPDQIVEARHLAREWEAINRVR
ncbi:MAG: hypothetical protein DHS20C01_27750 [marine bacterium B5-7]|nr:MAG: hypothetical protein DHS20C01_27750 [marine bacterium B5-7]